MIPVLHRREARGIEAILYGKKPRRDRNWSVVDVILWWGVYLVHRFWHGRRGVEQAIWRVAIEAAIVRRIRILVLILQAVCLRRADRARRCL
jgi:hypothetical protein